jgi:predicted nucleic acid-binding protein
MIYLLDTNVISETIKPSPNIQVSTWLSSIHITKFALSVITIGEIRKGVEKIIDQSKKQQIIQWLEIDLVEKFYGRIINIDQKVADKWGYICALNNVPAIDALIAASAMIHNCKLVTRNTKDFNKIVGLEIINPWQSKI